MAFRTLTRASFGDLLPHSASFFGHLPGRTFSNCSNHSLHFGPNFPSRKTLLCTAIVEDVESWRLTVQHYGPAVLLPSMAVLPFLAGNRKASLVCVDSVRSRLSHCMAQLFRSQRGGFGTLLTALILASAFYSDIAPPNAVDTFENVPQELNLTGGDKPRRIQRPKSKKAEGCTQKCLGTCIRGGAGSPGEGPFNVRRPLVVFKEGFRSRQYCLIECSEICNLIGDGDDGP